MSKNSVPMILIKSVPHGHNSTVFFFKFHNELGVQKQQRIARGLKFLKEKAISCMLRGAT